jgi:hypothetical protein
VPPVSRVCPCVPGRWMRCAAAARSRCGPRWRVALGLFLRDEVTRYTFGGAVTHSLSARARHPVGRRRHQLRRADELENIHPQSRACVAHICPGTVSAVGATAAVAFGAYAVRLGDADTARAGRSAGSNGRPYPSATAVAAGLILRQRP